MTFDEFVKALHKAGWVARNDAQHAHVRELWDDLCSRGLDIPMPNATADLPAMSEARETSADAFEADARLVASFRLPVSVKGLIVLSGWLRTQYGDGLTMRQQGEFLFITKPTQQDRDPK
jgi:hypothetical protein